MEIKNRYNSNSLGGLVVGSQLLTTNSLLYYLSFENYRNIIYVLSNHISYKNELDDIVNTNSMGYIRQLLKNKIIKQIEPDEFSITKLSKLNNLGTYHTNKMRFYSINQEVLPLLEETFIKSIFNNIDTRIKEYKIEQELVYHKMVVKEIKKEEQVQDREYLLLKQKYKIAMTKKPYHRTTDDWANISVFNHEEKIRK